MAFSENSKKVYNYVKENDGANFTAADIAEAVGLDVKQVNGIVTSAFQRKGYMKRTPAELENPDGTHRAVKLISLTDAGKEIDINAKDE